MKRFQNRRHRRGAALVEFAFWLPMMMWLLSGILDFSWFLANAQNVTQAARDGARAAAATRDDPATTGTNEAVGAGVAAAAWIKTTSPLTCADAVVTPFTQYGLKALRVKVTCDFVPLMGVYPQTFGSSAKSAYSFLPNQIESEFTMFSEIQ